MNESPLEDYKTDEVGALEQSCRLAALTSLVGKVVQGVFDDVCHTCDDANVADTLRGLIMLSEHVYRRAEFLRDTIDIDEGETRQKMRTK